MNWRVEAACRGMNPNVFYPEVGGAAVRIARTICNTCPVQTECLEDARQHREEYGVWGGKTVNERDRYERFNLNAPYAHLVINVDTALHHRPVDNMSTNLIPN